MRKFIRWWRTLALELKDYFTKPGDFGSYRTDWFLALLYTIILGLFVYGVINATRGL